jgi:S1-C subfamily serine protease
MRVCVAAIVSVLSAALAHAQEAIPIKTVAAIKDATAYLQTDLEGEDGRMTGSGFVIRADGTTGYLVTNAHVITQSGDRAPSRRRPSTKVVFRSGTKAEVEAVAEMVAVSEEPDLAILKVSGVKDLPRPIELTTETDLFETMPVYIFGFPFGQVLALGEGNPPVNVARGQVSGIRRHKDDRIKSVLVDGAINPGNSGGPVVDAKGRLVGIAVAAIRGANIGIAIAVPELLGIVKGQVEGIRLLPRGKAAGRPGLAAEVSLLDPLGRVKSVSLLYATALPLASGGKTGATGPMPGAKAVALELRGGQASGILPQPVSGSDLDLWCQAAFPDGAGRAIHTPPARFLLGAPKTRDAVLTVWGEVVDPDGDCRLRLEKGALVGDVPGTLHDLNIDINVINAPRVVQEIEGDFTVTVKVLGSFRPGRVRTGPKSVPYNGGGLVAWLDQDHYIRLERGSMFRDNHVLGFLAFESRELGTRAEVHNKGGLDPKQDLWLKLDREGNLISGAFSIDGREWTDLEPMDVEWPTRLKVGVDWVNSCGDPMTVRFEEYALARKPTL